MEQKMKAALLELDREDNEIGLHFYLSQDQAERLIASGILTPDQMKETQCRLDKSRELTMYKWLTFSPDEMKKHRMKVNWDRGDWVDVAEVFKGEIPPEIWKLVPSKVKRGEDRSFFRDELGLKT